MRRGHSRSRFGALLVTAIGLSVFGFTHDLRAQPVAPWGSGAVAQPSPVAIVPVPVSPVVPLLQPYPGAIPVHFESDGAPLAISVPAGIAMPTTALRPVEATGFGDANTPRMRVCQTPCTLYLPRGSFSVVLGGEGRRETTDTIFVGDRPQWVRYRSASRAAYAFGQVLLWTGGGSLVAGVLTLMSALQQPSTHDMMGPALALVFGAVATGIGIPTLLYNRVGRIRDPLPNGMSVRVTVGMAHDGTATGGVIAAF